MDICKFWDNIGQAVYSMGSMFNHSCRPNVHAYFISRTLLIRTVEYVPAGCPLEISYGPQVGQWNRKDRQKLLEERYSFMCGCRACSQLNLSDLAIHAFRCVNSNCLGVVLGQNSLEDVKLPLPAMTDERKAIEEVAGILSLQEDKLDIPNVGFCLTCSSHQNLEVLYGTQKRVMASLERLQEMMFSKKILHSVLCDAVESCELLRSAMHPYSKDIAQAEDRLAQAFSLIGEFQTAVLHCQASLEIIEKLYGATHLVIGHELIKLASIQLSLNDHIAAKTSIDRLHRIFEQHYGSHIGRVLPHLENFRKSEACYLLGGPGRWQ